MIGELPGDEAELRWMRERSTESGLIRIEAQLTPEEAAVVRKSSETSGGPPVEIVVHVEAESMVDVGSRRALRLRDRGCRFPGCANTRDDSHHVIPWSRGGETKLANLCSLCRRHHVYVHELGFRIEPRADGDFAFFAPAGGEVQAACTPPTLSSDPVASLRAGHEVAGLAIDSETSLPRWDGTPPDYDHIVYVLANRHPLEAQPGRAL
jgi:hypothetical protein